LKIENSTKKTQEMYKHDVNLREMIKLNILKELNDQIKPKNNKKTK